MLTKKTIIRTPVIIVRISGFLFTLSNLMIDPYAILEFNQQRIGAVSIIIPQILTRNYLTRSKTVALQRVYKISVFRKEPVVIIFVIIVYLICVFIIIEDGIGFLIIKI